MVGAKVAEGVFKLVLPRLLLYHCLDKKAFCFVDWCDILSGSNMGYIYIFVFLRFADQQA